MKAGVVCGEIEHGGDVSHVVDSLAKHGARNVEIRRTDFDMEEGAFVFEFDGDWDTFKGKVEDEGVCADRWMRVKGA